MSLTTEVPPHRILREVYRHYYEFEEYVASTGHHVIDRGDISISFYDLKDGISESGPLSERKRQAVMLNVIRDMKQRHVAEIMNITAVSVGQYVEQAMIQLSKTYFSELKEQSDVV
jgi:hypothetical protein